MLCCLQGLQMEMFAPVWQVHGLGEELLCPAPETRSASFAETGVLSPKLTSAKFTCERTSSRSSGSFSSSVRRVGGNSSASELIDPVGMKPRGPSGMMGRSSHGVLYRRESVRRNMRTPFQPNGS